MEILEILCITALSIAGVYGGIYTYLQRRKPTIKHSPSNDNLVISDLTVAVE